MKINSIFRSQFLALLMVVLICSHPSVVLAQQNSAEAQAKLDAEADFNKWPWRIFGFSGCLGVGFTTAVGAAIGSTADTGFLEFDNMIRGGCCGFIGGSAVLGGLILNYASYKITPPAERLIGKSPEYVDVYTDVYKAKTRQLRIKSTAAGAAVLPVIGIVGAGLSMVIEGSSD